MFKTGTEGYAKHDSRYDFYCGMKREAGYGLGIMFLGPILLGIFISAYVIITVGRSVYNFFENIDKIFIELSRKIQAKKMFWNRLKS